MRKILFIVGVIGIFLLISSVFVRLGQGVLATVATFCVAVLAIVTLATFFARYRPR